MKNKKFNYYNLFFYATVTLLIVLAYIFVLGFMQVFGWDYPNKGLIISWIAVAVFCVAIIFSFIKHKFTYKKIGTYVMHFSFIILLLGMFLYFCCGYSYKTYVRLSQNGNLITYDKVGEYKFNSSGYAETDGNGQYVYARSEKVDFNFALTDFKIDYYQAECRLVKLDKNDNIVEVIKKEIYPENGYYDLGEYGQLVAPTQTLTVSILKNTNKSDVKALLMPQSVKKYTATICFFENDKETYKTIIVNGPVKYDKWKIMLMSYDVNNKVAVFDFKYNPAEYLTDTGFILLMLSIFYTCLIQPNIKWKNNLEKSREGEDLWK